MTRRICRALEHPAAAILGHPTGRLLLKREPYQVDLEQVFEVAAKHGVLMEINAHPMRLDLNDAYCRMARELGVKIAISTDAHNKVGLDFMRFGIGQARRGWLEKDDVLNTRPWEAVRKLLRKS